MEREIRTSTYSPTSVYTKVFGWMALALLITFGVAIGGTFLLDTIDPNLYYGILVGASVMQLILVFVISFSGVLSKKQGAVKIPFILYAICMGVMMSSIIAVTDVTSIIYAFGSTFICFGSMALVGWLGRESNMRVMYLMATGLIIGSLVLTLFNIFLGSNEIDWIVSFATFAFILIMTAVDIYRMKAIADNGAMTDNLAIYFAFQIYYDFIYTFIRILMIFMRNRD